MGMNYYLKCQDCSKESEPIEFSICHDYRVKHLPEDLETLERDWVAFLAKHSGHKIALVDWRGYISDPAKISGGYVIGLHDFNKKFSSARASFGKRRAAGKAEGMGMKKIGGI